MTKNKLRILIFTFFCILAATVCLLIFEKSRNMNDENNKTWMSGISDEKKLSDLSIPGVHNAAASSLPLALFAKCQNHSISELLDAGYRYLDIRAGVSEADGKKSLVLYHNFIPCYRWDGVIPKKLTLDDVIESCYDFLSENPSETIIFMVKYEHGDISISEFEELIDKTIGQNSGQWLLTDETPCLKDARGKIVLYRRYEDEALLREKAGIECIWADQKNTAISDLNSILIPENEGGLLVQDMFKLTSRDKWEAFSFVYSNASGQDNKSGDYPTINFLSTTGTKSVGIPIYYAGILNQKFMNDSSAEQICPQWIIVDFGNEEIAQKIIEINHM